MKIQGSGKRYAIAVLNESGAFLGFVPDQFVPDQHPVTFPDHAVRFASVRCAEAAIAAVRPAWAPSGNRLIPWDMDDRTPADRLDALRDEETREVVAARVCSCPEDDRSSYLESLAICLEASAARLRELALDLSRRREGEGV